MIEKLVKQMQDGTLKLSHRRKTTIGEKAAFIDVVRKEVMGYKWDTGGLVHPIIGELIRIKEELKRRDRLEDLQRVEAIIRKLQGKG